MSGNWFAQKAQQIIWPWLNFQREVGGMKKKQPIQVSQTAYTFDKRTESRITARLA